MGLELTTSEIKSCALFWLSQPGAPGQFFTCRLHVLAQALNFMLSRRLSSHCSNSGWLPDGSSFSFSPSLGFYSSTSILLSVFLMFPEKLLGSRELIPCTVMLNLLALFGTARQLKLSLSLVSAFMSSVISLISQGTPENSICPRSFKQTLRKGLLREVCAGLMGYRRGEVTVESCYYSRCERTREGNSGTRTQKELRLWAKSHLGRV